MLFVLLGVFCVMSSNASPVRQVTLHETCDTTGLVKRDQCVERCIETQGCEYVTITRDGCFNHETCIPVSSNDVSVKIHNANACKTPRPLVLGRGLCDAPVVIEQDVDCHLHASQHSRPYYAFNETHCLTYASCPRIIYDASFMTHQTDDIFGASDAGYPLVGRGVCTSEPIDTIGTSTCKSSCDENFNCAFYSFYGNTCKLFSTCPGIAGDTQFMTYHNGFVEEDPILLAYIVIGIVSGVIIIGVSAYLLIRRIRGGTEYGVLGG